MIPLSGFLVKNKHQAREEEDAEEAGCGFSSLVQVEQHRVALMQEDLHDEHYCKDWERWKD